MLRPHNIEVVVAQTATEGIQIYRKSIHSFATVIVDYCLPDFKGTEVVQQICKINPSQDILFASGYQETDFLVDMLETGGARKFIPKGKPATEIKLIILDSIKIYELKNRILGFDDYSPHNNELALKSFGFAGRSSKLLQSVKKAVKYRDTPYRVLILGETGVGKELIAKLLVPTGKEIISVNCARYKDSNHFLESDFFGHVKGAFTGADKETNGLLSRASGQVLFLDELHELPLSAQAKLLRVLQEMKFRKMGDNSGAEQKVNVKIIAAAKPSIREMVSQGLFMEDVLHRIAQLEIYVPSLSERPEDFEPLIRSFQDEFNKDKPSTAQKQIRISTIHSMMTHVWSGNVRALQNAIRQILTDATTDIVSPIDFDSYLKNKNLKHTTTVDETGLDEATKEFERLKIVEALRKSRSQNEAATRLGIEASTLTRKLAKLQIIANAYLL